MNRIGVIGAGAFGTALASVICKTGKDVALWGRDRAQISAMQDTRENRRYLPEIKLPDALRPTADIEDIFGCELVLSVVPAQQLRGFLETLNVARLHGPFLACAKGIEAGTGLLQHEVARDFGVSGPIGAISGPGFATELTAGKPTALSLALEDAALGATVQSVLSGDSLRLYLTDDVTGVELGGALKNVYAIACGVVVGAGLGESARAALMTRAFAELSRLAKARGARVETLMGLSGFGDLALSCTSDQSRNFSFGLGLGAQGETRTTKTVEGIATAQAVLALATAHGVEMPIAHTVADVLQGRQTVRDALRSLMSRPLKREG